jgi:hypothetical protein
MTSTWSIGGSLASRNRNSLQEDRSRSCGRRPSTTFQRREDVHEVIAWADEEARRRSAMYTLYAVVSIGVEEGLVWLAGVDPTRGLGGPNFERRRPADVDPVSGIPAEVYRPAADS